VSGLTERAGRYVIDTNIAIALLNGDRGAAVCWSEADEVLIPAPVLAELLFGAQRSSRRAENEERIRALAAKMDFVPCDEVACERYAAVKASLANSGHPIPENDLWVAACALAADATLVTRDVIEHLPRAVW